MGARFSHRPSVSMYLVPNGRPLSCLAGTLWAGLAWAGVVSQGLGALKHRCPKARGTSRGWGGCSLSSPRAAAQGRCGLPRLPGQLAQHGPEPAPCPPERCYPGTEPRGISYKVRSAEGGDGGAPPASAPAHRAQQVGKGGPGRGGGRGTGPPELKMNLRGLSLMQPPALTFFHTHWDACHSLAFIY